MSDKSDLLREASALQRQAQLADEMPRYRMWCDAASPYAWKLRSYLDYKGIAWQRMRINAGIYFRDIPEKVGMSIIPVLMADGIHHVTLFDGFTPPFVRDGIADARIRHLKEKARADQ